MMRIQKLKEYGIPAGIIEQWEKHYGPELLSLQHRAVVEGGVLSGRSLVVSGATSSGKTLVGEMAAIQRAARHEKVIYLVPLKSLAEEKYRQFVRTYGAYGLRVLVSHRDRQTHDESLRQGQFDLAVVVYEKLQALLAREPDLLREVRLVVVDELQTVGDPERGGDLEILLTRILRDAKHRGGPFQMVGLSAVLGNPDELARWLEAGLLIHPERPLELRRGVLFGTHYQYHETNSGLVGHEILATPNSTAGDGLSEDTLDVSDTDPYHGEEVRRAALFFAAESLESTLVFVPTRLLSRHWAQMASDESNLPAAVESLRRLDVMEPSAARDILAQQLEKGVAFHNSDLGPELRSIVEEGFRTGEIKLLFCTATLAQGVNLAAKNTIIVPETYRYSERSGGFVSYSLPINELENQGGRAGRPGTGDTFGRMILVACSEHERSHLWTRYIAPPMQTVNGTVKAMPFEPVRSALPHRSWDTFVLQLVASKSAFTVEHLGAFFKETLDGERILSQNRQGEPALLARLAESISRLKCGRFLVELPDGTLAATHAGHLTATSGITAEGMDWLRVWLPRFEEGRRDVLEQLLLLCLMPEARCHPVPVKETEWRGALVREPLFRHITERGLDTGRVLKPLLEETPLKPRDKASALKKALTLYDWISDISTLELERRHNLFAGTIRNLAHEIAWLAKAAAAAGALRGWPETLWKTWDRLAYRLYAGVEEESLSIGILPVEGWSRDTAHALTRQGYDTPETLKQVGESEMARWIHPVLASRISAWANRKARTQVVTPELGADVTRDRLELTGVPVKRRTVARFNGHLLELPNSSYLVLLKLARARLAEAANGTLRAGWVYRDQLDSSDQWRAISRLRGQLAPHLADPKEAILENDGCGYYKLRVHPENLSVDESAHLNHWDSRLHPAQTLVKTA